MYYHSACPVCGNKNFTPFLKCKDHTVTGEEFNIVACNSCGFEFTNPIPDPADLGKYYQSEEYISHSDTKKGLMARVYQIARRYAISGKVKLIGKYAHKDKMLDYGCGTGNFLSACQQAGWSTTGMEPDSGARQLAKNKGLDVSGSLDELKGHLKPGSLNLITLWHVLEHVIELKDTLSFFSETLSSNGVLIIAVPNHSSHDAQHYGKFWAAYDVPRHLYHFHPETMIRLLSEFGFKMIDSKGMKLDSFYVSLLSEKYKGTGMTYLKAVWRGLVSNLKANTPGRYSSVIYVFKKI